MSFSNANFKKNTPLRGQDPCGKLLFPFLCCNYRCEEEEIIPTGAYRELHLANMEGMKGPTYFPRALYSSPKENCIRILKRKEKNPSNP